MKIIVKLYHDVHHLVKASQIIYCIDFPERFSSLSVSERSSLEPSHILKSQSPNYRFVFFFFFNVSKNVITR